MAANERIIMKRQSLWGLWIEFTGIFLLLPAALAALQVQRPVMYASLWLMTAYCFFALRNDAAISWQDFWRGNDWQGRRLRLAAVGRFCLATALTYALLVQFYPEHLFNFPRQRPWFWAFVMVAYPLLSVVPQEIIFRGFFLRRYQSLFPRFWIMAAVNSLCFGYMHIVLHNWVAPLLSVIGSVIFVHGYRQHRALKWAIIEHAAYGCMIFTVGLGWFFFRGFP